MIVAAVVLIMLACGYAQYRNGLFSSVAMLMMVMVAGVAAFGFWEPIADWLDPMFQTNALSGCEDFLTLVAIFSVALLLLRLATNTIAPDMIEEHGTLQHFGAAGVGVITGYLLAGFLVCAMQTLPLDENFLDFQPRSPTEPVYRSLVPGDRVWLAMMRHAGAGPFAWKEDPAKIGQSAVDRYFTFDNNATFELRYQRYRRLSMPYLGEFDQELGRPMLR